MELSSVDENEGAVEIASVNQAAVAAAARDVGNPAAWLSASSLIACAAAFIAFYSYYILVN